jgi:hypothetical protein
MYFCTTPTQPEKFWLAERSQNTVTGAPPNHTHGRKKKVMCEICPGLLHFNAVSGLLKKN